ncbi:MAG: hypothetical protein J07HB67_00799 [halophilic archaeon J07HB67]|jgi:hypothetical protein|nr:MAG: hypothetical protein J07HB67_00799 [halophilic archaeon J07HB67]
MDLESAREDTVVAVAAAGTAVAATVLTELVLGLETPLVVRAVPLVVYLSYRLSRKGGPYGSWDTPSAWAVVAVASGVATVAFAVV